MTGGLRGSGEGQARVREEEHPPGTTEGECRILLPLTVDADAANGKIGDLRLGDFSLGSRAARGSAPNLVGGGEMRLSLLGCLLLLLVCRWGEGGEIWAGVQLLLLLRLSPGEVDSTSCANLNTQKVHIRNIPVPTKQKCISKWIRIQEAENHHYLLNNALPNENQILFYYKLVWIQINMYPHCGRSIG